MKLLHMDLSSFILVWRIPFSISCRTDLLEMNFLSFCLLGNVLICCFWRIVLLLDIESSENNFFSSRTLSMSSYCLLASMFFDKISAVNLIEDLLYVMNHFSLLSRFNICLLTVWLWYMHGMDLKFILLGVHH